MAIITISRGTFSGGYQLAECLADKLGYRCISGETLLDASKQYSVSEESLSKALADEPGTLERLSSDRQRYLAYIRAALIKEGRDEKLVYHGYAGHLLLYGVPHIIRVKIISSMDSRIKALADHRNVNREEARHFIERSDRKREEWTRFFYHVDWNDISIYDIVLNTDNINLANACDAIDQLANSNDFKITEQSQKTMNDLVLSSHIEALIAGNRNISGKVEIKANDGVVTIEGTASSSLDADRVQKLVHETPGVKDIISRMKVKFSGVSTQKLEHS